VAVNGKVPGPSLRHAALGQPVALASAPRQKESPFAWAACGPVEFLTDGYVGNVPDWQIPEWLGFDKDLEATIDLGKVTDLREVGANFMQHVWAGVFIPATMEVLVSDDGKEFTKVGAAAHQRSKTGEMIKTLSIKPDAARGRYVRIKAPTGGHWLFVDELFVNPTEPGH
jgi:hexosaminidase